eukprot:9641203-Alexandrium_andersonii.AAC.1
MTADHTGRKRSICVDESYMSVMEMENEADKLWRTYLGYDRRSTSSSSSLVASLQSTDTKVYYVQDHHDYDVCAMPVGLPDTLDIAKAEKEEDEERRRTERATVHHEQQQPQPQQQQQHPKVEEHDHDDTMGLDGNTAQKASMQPPTPQHKLGAPGD